MTEADVWLIVGLGNPGPTYAGHRHNVGYLVTDVLASRQAAGFRSHKSGRAAVVEGRIDGHRTVLGRPRTFMNEVGGPIKALMGFYKVTPDRLVVIHDELDLEFEALRVKFGGGDNGHNGLRSIRSSLGTGDFFRVRVGIGRPPGRQEVPDFVLSNYSTAERTLLDLQVERAADATECLIAEGLERTQQQFNGSGR